MAEDEWTNAVIERDTATIATLCSSDFIYLPQDSPRLDGHSQVVGFLDTFPPVESARQTLDDVSGSRALAVLCGTIEAALMDGDTVLRGKGKFLATATRASGAWLFTRAAFNWDGPLA